MERRVYDRLLWQLEKLGDLDASQCFYRKKRSTTDHLFHFESLIHNSFIHGDKVVSVLFDLEKAYDTTWKHCILKDLESLDLAGNLCTFISNFLSYREFQVRIGSTLSDHFEQEMGVPQGSILSPLLFNININNIAKLVNPDFDKTLFVDDFSVSIRGKTLAGIERKFQLCINKIEKWVEGNGFKFSVTKTEYSFP